MIEIKTYSQDETALVATTLGKLLNGGEVLCLNGDLGTGKTAFTGGIAKGLEIDGYITSPTFTLVNEYMGRLPMYHFDVYRISDSDEMFEIGFDEYLESNGVVIIEWAELIKDILPMEYISISIEKTFEEGFNTRVIKLEFKGEKYKNLEEQYEGSCC